MSHVRTVLGDLDPAELGITYAHEHVIIAGGRPVELSPDFLLDDVDLATAELVAAKMVGLGAVVDAMPADCGRDVLALAEVSRRSGVHVIAPTGLHQERFYDARHWSRRASVDELVELYVADVETGIDAEDYGGPIVRRTGHRAGVIKVGGSGAFPSERDRRVFTAAAIAQVRTGCPILTHCEDGRFGLEQVRLLVDAGADAAHVVLSHVDKVVEREYHRELAAAGAILEYDGAFRWKDGPNGTLRLLGWMAEDGLLDRVVLGLDAARRGYWTVYGGAPGMAYLLDGFDRAMRAIGLDDAALRAIFVANPARASRSLVRASEACLGPRGRAADRAPRGWAIPPGRRTWRPRTRHRPWPTRGRRRSADPRAWPRCSRHRTRRRPRRDPRYEGPGRPGRAS
jgi:phosphotriesterase-related protein